MTGLEIDARGWQIEGVVYLMNAKCGVPASRRRSFHKMATMRARRCLVVVFLPSLIEKVSTAARFVSFVRTYFPLFACVNLTKIFLEKHTVNEIRALPNHGATALINKSQ